VQDVQIRLFVRPLLKVRQPFESSLLLGGIVEKDMAKEGHIAGHRHHLHDVNLILNKFE